MAEPSTTFRDIIDRWRIVENGRLTCTPQELAADLGTSSKNVYDWRRRNSIPAKYWPAIMQSAEKRGIVLERQDFDAALAASAQAA